MDIHQSIVCNIRQLGTSLGKVGPVESLNKFHWFHSFSHHYLRVCRRLITGGLFDECHQLMDINHEDFSKIKILYMFLKHPGMWNVLPNMVIIRPNSTSSLFFENLINFFQVKL